MRYYATRRPIAFEMTHGTLTLPKGHLVRSPGRIPPRFRRFPYSAMVCVVYRCSPAFVAPHEVDLVAEGPFYSVAENQ